MCSWESGIPGLTVPPEESVSAQVPHRAWSQAESSESPSVKAQVRAQASPWAPLAERQSARSSAPWLAQLQAQPGWSGLGPALPE